MRTTIDIPEDLLRQAKSTAALRGLKLKDLVTSYIEHGLNGATVQLDSELPVKLGHPLPLPKFLPMTDRPIRSFTNAEIDEIFLEQDWEKFGLR